MKSVKDNIVFICGANDFHAIDKYRITAKEVFPRQAFIITDVLKSENKPLLVTNENIVYHLYNIDWLLFNHQSKVADIWRNFIKFMLLPVQVYYLKRFYKKNPSFIYHAIPMYYMLLCSFAKVPYIGTPQGSEVLIRPNKSKIYKFLASRCLRDAEKVIVDSVNMRDKVIELSSVTPIVLKNGFDTSKLLNIPILNKEIILSIRGFYPNYRIDQIIKARNNSKINPALIFVYPACALNYKIQISNSLSNTDIILGRLERDKLYSVMSKTLLAISIPESDSSPRSVYECIFAGACVAITYAPFIEEMPKCMKERIYLVDLNNENWLDDAIHFARNISATQFVPSEEALNFCDQNRTIRKVVDLIYNLIIFSVVFIN